MRKKPLLNLLFLILVFLFFLRVVIDPDLGYHLMTGKYIWQTKTIPQKDIFSFSLPDYPYVYHSWLTEVLLFLIYHQWDLWGVTFFYCFLATVAFWFILKTTQLKVSQNWVYLFLLLMVPLVYYATNLRIQLFTFLGLAFLYFVFRKSLKKETRLVWSIPLIFLLWANLHGGFLLGLVFFISLLIIEAFGFFAQKIIPLKVYGNFGPDLPFKRGLTWFLVFLLSAAVVLVNPYGMRAYQQAFLMGSNQFASKFNIDWSPLVRAGDLSFLFAFLLVMGISFLVLIKSKVELREKLALLLFFLLSLKLNRFSLPLLVIFFPSLIFFCKQAKQKLKVVLSQMRLAFFLVLFCLGLVFFGQAFGFISRMKKTYSDEAAYAQEMPAPYTYPYGAVEYLKTNPVGERLLNDYNWGGYLIWKLPARKYFIDGRMDNFFLKGESFAKLHWQIVNLDPSWQTVLEKYQIEAVLLSSKWPVAQALRISPQWQLLYEDETSVLFEKVN